MVKFVNHVDHVSWISRLFVMCLDC